MLNNDLENSCRKILSYGMCLDIAANATHNIRRQTDSEDMKVQLLNRVYRTTIENIVNNTKRS